MVTNAEPRPPVVPEPPPLIVQYLYVHGDGEAFFYPTSRSSRSAAQVANRYLECALTQAASLRLRETDCDLALVTNLGDPSSLGRAGARLVRCIESLGVQILPTEYRHRPVDTGGENYDSYVSSRYVLDAILAAAEGQPANRQLWLTDLDCVWPDAACVLAAAPPAPEIGYVQIPYPPDWDVVGFGPPALSRAAIGELALGMGGSQSLPSWVGGELLTGTPDALRALVSACEDIDERLAAQGAMLPTEEQTLTLVGALELARFSDLSNVARRILTGPRHGAVNPENPLDCGFWHLPSEKGLSLRRAANEMLAGRPRRLRRDLADPARAARRFNVRGTGLPRRIRDDGWLAAQRLRSTVLAPLGIA
jgi:hypothetical protein